ncbi:MAG TPA: NADH-quinone oxidoreductase subunit C [Armatimonadota bacterium]|nr:NADH-quinone oxidoreductase subunit C [Armatimonadota bacterium]
MLGKVTDITTDELLNVVQTMSLEGYRFVTASCVSNPDGPFELIYHFDRDTYLTNYRLYVRKNEEVPSISKIYFCAILVENEMKELFGLNVKDIAIDYGGRMLLAEGAPTAPMACGGQITVERR